MPTISSQLLARRLSPQRLTPSHPMAVNDVEKAIRRVSLKMTRKRGEVGEIVPGDVLCELSFGFRCLLLTKQYRPCGLQRWSTPATPGPPRLARPDFMVLSLSSHSRAVGPRRSRDQCRQAVVEGASW